jgi:hypothetical protein
MVVDLDESSSGSASASGSDSDDDPVQLAASGDEEIDDTPVWLRGRHVIHDELEDWLFENPAAAGTMVYRPFEEWCEQIIANSSQAIAHCSVRKVDLKCFACMNGCVAPLGDSLATPKSLRHLPATWSPISRSLVE